MKHNWILIIANGQLVVWMIIWLVLQLIGIDTKTPVFGWTGIVSVTIAGLASFWFGKD